MGMGIDCVKQFRGKKISQLDVLVGLVELRIDDDAFFFLRTTQEIGQAAARPDLLENDIACAHGQPLVSRNRNNGFFFHVVAAAVDLIQIVAQKTKYHARPFDLVRRMNFAGQIGFDRAGG
jgi:hypothetical protein